MKNQSNNCTFNIQHPVAPASSLQQRMTQLFATGDFQGVLKLGKTRRQTMGYEGLQMMGRASRCLFDRALNRQLLVQALRYHAQAALEIDPLQHPLVWADNLSFAAGILGMFGQYEEAELLLRMVVKIRERDLDPAHPKTAEARADLVRVLQTTEQFSEARTPHRRLPSTRGVSANEATSPSLRHEETLMRCLVMVFFRFTAQTGRRHPSLLEICKNYILLCASLHISSAELIKNFLQMGVEAGLAQEKMWQMLDGLAEPVGPFEVHVTAVLPGSQGEELGLQVGDILCSYDGGAIDDMDELIDRVAENQNHAVPLGVQRGHRFRRFFVQPGLLGLRIGNRPYPVKNSRPQTLS